MRPPHFEGIGRMSQLIVRGSEKIVLDRTINVHIKNLRDGLGPAAGLIKNIRGVGYKLEE